MKRSLSSSPSSKYPDSPLQAAALFLAGKAAQQSNTGSTLNAALNIFKTLGAGTPPLPSLPE